MNTKFQIMRLNREKLEACERKKQERARIKYEFEMMRIEARMQREAMEKKILQKKSFTPWF